MLAGKRLTLRGFLVSDFEPRRAEFERAMAGWIAEGKVRLGETIVGGVENMPEALLGLFRGDNVGKMLVRTGAAE
jgi:NADPH-dependent curcumin reductase CurA